NTGAESGRIDIDFDSKLVRRLSVLYSKRTAPYPEKPSDEPLTSPVEDVSEASWPTKLNIVIQIVGSRGDVQPFIALGNELQRYGHRVRLATHDAFEQFVRSSNLEFYPIGGDPADLMAYMVKNPGLLPSMKSLAAGEIQKKRYMVSNMLDGLWESCIKPDASTGDPFVADAIIANPPSFAHVHCAQALGIPVHLMFTMPWSSTSEFPHPLANLKNVSDEDAVANYISYGIVEWMTWQGLGDIINKWRRSIDLEEIAMFDGPMIAQTLKIPFTYCWSPALVPKPVDWPSYIDVCGFFFRNPPTYKPTVDFDNFLVSGSRPVYIGFGSIVLDDPNAMVKTILDAVRSTGVRAIISKGWSHLAGSADENIYWIGDCPHEWLFQHVAAVVHHGGAGTTACGLRNGKPTTIVPFFGDQPFWGNMVAKAGAGPPPIPHTELTSSNLADAIQYCLSDQAQSAAADIASRMSSESGVQAAARSFHRQLPLERMRCDLIPEQPAVWSYTKAKRPIKLSKLAAEIISAKSLLEPKHLKLYETNPTLIETTRWDPISGGSSAVMATAVDLAGSITGMVTKPVEEYHDERRKRARGLKLTGSDVMVSTHQSKETQHSLAGKMATASLKSIGGFAPTALKGMMVDFPLAITEGMKSVPGHYGGNVRDHGPITNAKSGATVAGKTFVWGMLDGISDVVVQPYKGAKKEGAVGAAKGLGKGAMNLVTKTGAGMFGLLAYPGAGIAKSLRAATHQGTRKMIMQARHAEGQWMVKTGSKTG
ncbi:hypothetical protein EDB81DRAFT_918891, partial [Dactylonectria macrodidyma]